MNNLDISLLPNMITFKIERKVRDGTIYIRKRNTVEELIEQYVRWLYVGSVKRFFQTIFNWKW